MNNWLAKISSIASFASALLLIIWWFGILFLPGDKTSPEDYRILVSHGLWVPFGFIGMGGFFSFLIAVVGMYFRTVHHSSRSALFGFLTLLIAIPWFSGINYYETILWPVLAQEVPDFFVSISNPSSAALINIMDILGSIIWVSGFVLFGLGLFKTSQLTKSGAVLLTVGAVLFGIGQVVWLRSIGLVLMAFGQVLIGIRLFKTKEENSG